jgi:hypothetical protein
MGDFLGKLADQLNDQFSVGENEQKTLNLGDFGKQIDRSAERRYVEEGYLRRDPYNTEPKQFEILMQEPNATVLIKKRMFSSVAENYRPDFMDKDEKLFYKTMKILFQNKCRQIAALEKLSKIQKITSAVGNVSDQLIPIIISLTDDAGSGFSAGGPDLFGGLSSNGDVSNFTKVVDRIRRVYAFNTSAEITSWITDSTNLFQTQYGQGTGVIEITNFTGFDTSSTLNIASPGTFNLNISDPYEAMLITEFDIEKAISDATNSFYNHQIIQFGKEAAETNINDLSVSLNKLRSDRKASPISFKVDPDTLLGKRVTAILDRLGIELIFHYDGGFGGIGGNVSVADDYLRGGDIAGFDGLDTAAQQTFGADSTVKKLVPDSELSVFKQLVSATFNKIQLDTNSTNVFKANNKDTNYVRRKMRFNFCGKLIIQPMDPIHIYLSSKSRYDNKLLSGLTNMFTGSGILQNLNKTLTDFTNSFSTLFNPSGNVNLQIEKSSFVGPDFPNFLWSLIRNQFVVEKEGTHVFGGVVQTATDNWSDGKFNVSIGGTDNSYYFDLGKINFKPSVDVFSGSLFDPLTPFKTKFDRVSSLAKNELPELLDENKVLLGSSEDKDGPLVKFKLGPNAGQRATEDNYIQDRSVDDHTGFINKTFYAPDGLVYKWKEGIGVLTQSGNSLSLNDANRVGAPSLYNDPFAGQDVMNVLSLLITGIPYNFATYWKAISTIDGFKTDPLSNQNASYSYYSSLRNDLTKNNVLWGNFIPFKNLVMDEQSYAQAVQGQFKATQRNTDLDNKLKRLAELNRSAVLFGVGASQYPGSDSASKLDEARSEIATLKTDINSIISAAQTDDRSFAANQNMNNDVTQDYNNFIDSSKLDSQPSDPTLRRNIRRQVNNITRRMSYNVRGNEDKNLLIIDDSYDKDYDLIAYENSLTDGIKLYNNEFENIKEKIVSSASLLQLEVFCDTQGHIRIRPPQYNRMPSSVFYRMMFLKKVQGIQVFPQFIDDYFSDQINALKQRVEILEDQIRLDCAILDYDTDAECLILILSSPSNLDGPIYGAGDTFEFLSNSAGEIDNFDKVIAAANPDQKDAETDSIKTFTSLQKQAQSNKAPFGNTARAGTILQSLTTEGLSQAGYGIQDVEGFNTNQRIQDLIDRIQSKSGMRISKVSYLIQDQSKVFDNVSIDLSNGIDVFKVTQELSDKISERQRVLKLLYGAVKNASELQYLDNDDSNSNQLLTPGNYSNTHVPEVFEHMIEDETYDDYGIGAGSRYIIKRAQIRSINIAEQPPEFTYIQVNGQLNTFVSNNTLPAELKVFPQQGNGLVSAAAVDYDTWRNYGFRDTSPINVPFLNDPETQCAPYASMILGRARKNILRGTVTISGNEYMQPGEVVFLEDRALLFYVNSVRHNFTFGSTFTTTLELTYGHTPGEYIPVPLDVIGKLLYNNKDNIDFTIQRQSNSSNDLSVGVIQKDANNSSSSTLLGTGDSNSQINSFAAANSQVINNILYNVAYIINSNNTKGNTIQASIELRIYYDDNNGVDSDLSSFAGAAKTALTSDAEGPKQAFNNSTGASKNPTLKSGDVNVVTVNLSDENDRKSPSQKALDAARNQLNRSGKPMSNPEPSGSQEKDRLRKALFNYVVDCWVKFEPVSPEEANSTGSVNV